MKSFLLLVVHFCTFINQEENMSRTLLKAALALVLLWILVAWWSLGGAITETPPLCCGETQLSRSEREDQCPLPLFQPFVIPPTQPQPAVFQQLYAIPPTQPQPAVFQQPYAIPPTQPQPQPPTQPQPVVFKAYIRWRCGNITHSLPESIHLFAFLKTLPSSNPRDVVPLKYMFRPIKGH